MRAYPIAYSIVRRMKASRKGVFSAKDFIDFGTRAGIDQALTRLARSGKIRRIARGLYDIPRKSTLVGTRSASTDAIAAAIARKSSARIALTGAQTANLLGLSTQVPAQARYLTDRTPRKVRIGRQLIQFDHAAPRRLTSTNRSHAVIEAIRYIGKDRIGEHQIEHLRSVLSSRDKQKLWRQMGDAPHWMHPILAAITDERVIPIRQETLQNENAEKAEKRKTSRTSSTSE